MAEDFKYKFECSFRSEILPKNKIIELISDPDLHQISLGRMDITDEILIELLKSIKTNQNLKYLILPCNKITDKGAIAIAEFLETDESLSLKEIDLRGNQITENGIIAMTSARPDNKKSGHEIEITLGGSDLNENVKEAIKFSKELNCEVGDILNIKKGTKRASIKIHSYSNW